MTALPTGQRVPNPVKDIARMLVESVLENDPNTPPPDPGPAPRYVPGSGENLLSFFNKQSAWMTAFRRHWNWQRTNHNDPEPELPPIPRLPARGADKEARMAYQAELRAYEQAEQVYDEWLDRQLERQENEGEEGLGSDDAQRQTDYVRTHQHVLAPSFQWGPPREKLKYDHLRANEPIPLAEKLPYAVFEWGNFVFIKFPADEAWIKQEGRNMRHPVAGGTGVVTYEGIRPIRDLVGKGTVRFLTRNKRLDHTCWAAGTVQAYGKQPITEVVLSRAGREITVSTTDEHRWYAYTTRNKKYMRLTEMPTSGLKPGFRIPSVYAKTVSLKPSKTGVSLSSVGVMHGIVFGDGHATASKPGRTVRSGQITLYGKKDAELLKWFPKPTRQNPSARSIGGTTLHDLPRYFKELPSAAESPAYLLGWLAGYVAADGNVDEHGRTALASHSEANLRFAETICVRLGIHTLGISKQTRVGFGKTSDLYTLSFEVGALPASFYLIRAHRRRIKRREKASLHWTVKDVRKTNRQEEVFCAIVPETGCFVLEGNILTGNCLEFDYKRYTERLRRGDQLQFSMVDKRDEMPKVDTEVALTTGSYSSAKITRPVVTQIRGIANQCPPADEYVEPLIRFYETYGKDWQLTGHGVRNFDGDTDGDKLLRRWKEMQAEQSAQ